MSVLPVNRFGEPLTPDPAAEAHKWGGEQRVARYLTGLEMRVHALEQTVLLLQGRIAVLETLNSLAPRDVTPPGA